MRKPRKPWLLPACMAVVLVLLSLAGWSGRTTRYESYTRTDANFWSQPLAALPLLGLRDGVLPWSQTPSETSAEMTAEESAKETPVEAAEETPVETAEETPVEAAEEAPVEVAEETPVEAGKVAADEKLAAPDDGIEADGHTESDNARELDGAIASAGDMDLADASEPVEEDIHRPIPPAHGNTASEQKRSFTQVDDDYFRDALFLGDSRIAGLSEYCEPLDTRATFYAKISMTIYKLLTEPFVKTSRGKITVDEALQQKQYGKIYIMVGINELGTGDTDYFLRHYRDVILRIRQLQPDALIYINGMMHVTAEKNAKDRIFNNTAINERNAAIALLANDIDIFYLDMNPATDDENGNLSKPLSYDEVHLMGSSYELWHQFLLTHAIVRE